MNVSDVEAVLPSPKEFLELLERKWPYEGGIDTTKRLKAACYTASHFVLKDFLRSKGIWTRVVCGTYDDDDRWFSFHCWLETKEGIVIDPTECQFDKTIPVGQIRVYPSRPDRYESHPEDLKQFALSAATTYYPRLRAARTANNRRRPVRVGIYRRHR